MEEKLFAEDLLDLEDENVTEMTQVEIFLANTSETEFPIYEKLHEPLQRKIAEYNSKDLLQFKRIIEKFLKICDLESSHSFIVDALMQGKKLEKHIIAIESIYAAWKAASKENKPGFRGLLWVVLLNTLNILKESERSEFKNLYNLYYERHEKWIDENSDSSGEYQLTLVDEDGKPL